MDATLAAVEGGAAGREPARALEHHGAAVLERPVEAVGAHVLGDELLVGEGPHAQVGLLVPAGLAEERAGPPDEGQDGGADDAAVAGGAVDAIPTAGLMAPEPQDTAQDFAFVFCKADAAVD